MNILVTNDDGISSEYTLTLAETLRFLGHTVTVVVPKSNKSAVSHSITLRKPITVIQYEKYLFGIEGTPVDCIYLALNAILPEKPDLIISGINNGPNYGDDVIYSGTVAAAREGFMKGIKSIALSLLFGENQTVGTLVPFIAPIALELSKYPLDHYFFNVNIPNIENLETDYYFTSLSKRKWDEEVEFLSKNDNIVYYAIGGTENVKKTVPGTDAAILKEGKISVTPLYDLYTNGKVLKNLLNQK